ncbi:MAG: hypothetical protein WAL78_12465, partial [Candidatus Acidiferrales bacterium]
CEIHYSRITKIFGKVDGDRFRQATRYIQERVQRIGQDLSSSLPFDPDLKIEGLLALVLPPDDSAFQFSAAGVGLSSDLDATMNDLFGRFVEKYSLRTEHSNRDDAEVWRVYREPLEKHQVISHLRPKRIVSPNFDYEFEHSWKNERWHLYEPLSLDLLEPNSILDKANRWLGRGTNLADSNEQFKIHLLLGEPQDPGLRSTFDKARNILHKIPGKPELIRESEAEQFAEGLAGELKAHDDENGKL